MAYIDNKRIFVAGATGLAGTAVIKCLLDGSPSVRVRASLHSNKQPNITDNRVEYVYGDLRNQDDCRRVLQGCNCVIMVAASGGGAVVLNSEPWKQVNDNLLMGAQLLEACIFAGITRIVCADSATLYQAFEGHIKEDQLDMNKDPFPSYLGVGWVTRLVEKLCWFWHVQRGIEIVIARTSNIFGPFARFDPSASNFIPALTRKAVDKMDPFEVWGSPDVTRDVLYVEDFARAIVLMMNRQDIKFDIFNLGSGVKTTVGSVVEWVLKYSGHKPSKLIFQNNKPTTIGFRALDCVKAKDILGWQPQISIEQGVAKTVAWWIENRDKWTR